MKLTQQQLNEILARPGIAKANPDLGAVGRTVNAKPARALERHAPKEQSSESSLRVSVEIVGVRSRLLDSDNFTAGAKPLRDAIAKSLAIDDGSDRIKFNYTQVLTTGQAGTIVRISWI
jgi:hypothetical protein